ncbi:MAG TPA: hypothetical protein VMU95_12630 [Trebonia sp.]|nr:hypothetical protein [Trebonia sp.]
MSEYQYYEFLALDKALTSKERAELRQLSTRAEITATRFSNEYDWGSFRGDPAQMMAKYFDAFLYLANWGTRHLMFRVPKAALSTELAQQYCLAEAASLIETDDHLIISLYADHEPDDLWYESHGDLGSMVAARSELLAGDHRLLYLAWLMEVQWYNVADEDPEPPVPAGLADLSGALATIADFLGIDEDLIAVAAEASPPLTSEPAADLADLISALPAADKDKLLTMVASGEGAQAQSLLLQRLRSGPLSQNEPAPAARTAAQLWTAAEEHGIAREAAEAQALRAEEERRAAAEAAAYEKHLNQLASRAEAAWLEAEDLIATKRPHDYDLAVTLLRDLFALARRDAEHDSFTRRFLELRTRHERKPSLQDRLDAAGLPRRP